MKEFNYTGVCIPKLHYMVNVSGKLNKIEKLIKKGKYFAISRPRQYGKSTCIFLLEERLKNDFFLISTSFEGTGKLIFESEERFCKEILSILAKGVINDNNDLKDSIHAEDKNFS
ncbi:MAG: hypothetical protein HQM10_15830 [Candidatus Riflebacteria bacterium]|nr:hypothetical protein [Candidatus Riflebacteria bacterium]